MADHSRRLVSKIVLEEDLLPVLNAGVRPDWFDDAEHRKAYVWILEYFSRYSKAPNVKTFKGQFPTYSVIRVPEPYDFYVDEFKALRRRSLLVDAVADAYEALGDDDPVKAQNILSVSLGRIGSEISSLSDTDAVESWKMRWDGYEERRLHKGELTGVPTGFPTFDVVTGGFQNEQFILFGGAQKQMKSWMLMKAAVAAQEYGRKVLFITFEMSQDEQLARYDAYTCGLDSNKLLRGTLNKKDMEKLEEGMRKRRNLPPFIISADISATTTVSGLSGKIEEHQPDIVFIDGCYLMENEIGAQSGTPQAYTSISRGLKRMAQRIQKPIIGSTQALTSKMGREHHVTMHSFAWSSAWAQDADLLIGTERVGDSPAVCVRIVGGRNVSPCEVIVSCNWNESIFEEMHPEDDDEE